jgi:hypothetical protein
MPQVPGIRPFEECDLADELDDGRPRVDCVPQRGTQELENTVLSDEPRGQIP